MDDRYSLPPDVAAALERARLQVEALAQTADELQVVLPDAVGSALFINSNTDTEAVAARPTSTASFCRCCANVE